MLTRIYETFQQQNRMPMRCQPLTCIQWGSNSIDTSLAKRRKRGKLSPRFIVVDRWGYLSKSHISESTYKGVIRCHTCGKQTIQAGVARQSRASSRNVHTQHFAVANVQQAPKPEFSISGLRSKWSLVGLKVQVIMLFDNSSQKRSSHLLFLEY
jgi:hypothetical protein